MIKEGNKAYQDISDIKEDELIARQFMYNKEYNIEHRVKQE